MADGMGPLYLIKLGGSVITDISRQNTARTDVINRLFYEIRSASGECRVVLGHGAGSFGHVIAHKFKVNEGINGSFGRRSAVETQFSASELHSIVMTRAVMEGIDALSFSPSTGVIAREGKIVSWDTSPISKALEFGFIPIVYGDLVIDSARGFSVASTEEVIRYLSTKLSPQKIIVGTDVDGVFTADPKSDKSAKLIPKITKDNISKVLDSVGGSSKVDVTGGMKSKLEYLFDISKSAGIPCQIINASTPGVLQKALEGEKVGTEISAK